MIADNMMFIAVISTNALTIKKGVIKTIEIYEAV
jgi:hypothetical protein